MLIDMYTTAWARPLDSSRLLAYSRCMLTEIRSISNVSSHFAISSSERYLVTPTMSYKDRVDGINVAYRFL
jgi:hypothetical protein